MQVTKISEENSLPTVERRVHVLPLTVRDYECDMGMGVNNAVYLHYLEHGRFEFVRKELKWDMADLAKQHIGFVVAKMEIEFRHSLVAPDEFILETSMERIAKRRFLFHQDIYMANQESGEKRKHVLAAKVFLSPINTLTLRPETPEALEKLLVEFPIIEQA